MSVTLRINGQSMPLDVEDELPLLWALRDVLGLTGTKFGCGVAACGACTVHVDGTATRSCVLPVGSIGTREITTIEGLGADGRHAVQRAWLDARVPQCGYCQSGMIMAAVALLRRSPAPAADEIDRTLDNICRCGTYPRVRSAVLRAAAAMAQP